MRGESWSLRTLLHGSGGPSSSGSAAARYSRSFNSPEAEKAVNPAEWSSSGTRIGPPVVWHACSTCRWTDVTPMIRADPSFYYKSGTKKKQFPAMEINWGQRVCSKKWCWNGKKFQTTRQILGAFFSFKPPPPLQEQDQKFQSGKELKSDK